VRTYGELFAVHEFRAIFIAQCLANAAAAAGVAADKGYQDEQCIRGMRGLGVVPLVAEFKASKNWKNWLNEAERKHPRFASSQRIRRRVEKVFAWIKTVAGLRQTKLRGRARVDWLFRLTAAVHNLVRMVKLLPAG